MARSVPLGNMPINASSMLDVKMPLSEAAWSPRILNPVAGLVCQTFDLAALGAVAFSLFVVTSLPADNISVPQFLSLRISFANILVAVFCFSLWRILLWGVGLYTPRRTRSIADYVFRCLIAISACSALAGLAEAVRRPGAPFMRTIGLFWVEAFGLMLLVRIGLIVFFRHIRPMFRPERKLIILGTGPRALQVYRELKDHTLFDYSLLGFVDSEPQGSNVPPELILGRTEDLEDLLMREIVDEVVIALPMKSQYEIVGHAVAVCERLGIQSQYFSDHFGSTVTKRRYAAGPQTGRIVMQVVHHDSRRYLKRLFDFTAALGGLVVLSPLLLVTAIAVKVTSPGPILFRQERFGLGKRRFWMLKFRSMCVDAEARQAALEHLNETSGAAFKIKKDPRVTPIGGILRKLSIDELPQLVNVLIGDMSLVGPRPLPMRDVSRFSEAWLMRRFSVKPGLTCLWQIMGRSNTDFDRWMQLDLQYIDNWSLSLDMLILFKTLPAVLMGSGAS
jgi:exopolysaccharide biosynthesis polyprenyl glycosylphosphotransferase